MENTDNSTNLVEESQEGKRFQSDIIIGKTEIQRAKLYRLLIELKYSQFCYNACFQNASLFQHE